MMAKMLKHTLKKSNSPGISFPNDLYTYKKFNFQNTRLGWGCGSVGKGLLCKHENQVWIHRTHI